MINRMNQLHAQSLSQSFSDPTHQSPRFIYVAPILSEVERIKKACPDFAFRDPQPVGGKKLNHLASLVAEGANICTTHALFKLLNRDICEKLNGQGYTLIIDEELECVRPFDGLTASDRRVLFNTHRLHAHPVDGRLRWNHALGSYSGKFNQVRDLCDNGSLVLCRENILWEFPIAFLNLFKHSYILTYLFSGSAMSAYLKANGLSYNHMTLNEAKDGLVPHAEGVAEAKEKVRLRGLIKVYEGDANRCGESKGKSNPFSSRWCDRETAALNRVKAHLQNWFRKVAATPSCHNAWTTYKEAKKHLTGSPYGRGFIPCNAKGTNDHIERRSLAYLCNLFYNPTVKGYFEHRGIAVDEDQYALSEMIQWIWRSQIRRCDPITVYIPSDRMRRLFTDWLHGRASVPVNQPERLAA
jgi:hypothetical protein